MTMEFCVKRQLFAMKSLCRPFYMRSDQNRMIRRIADGSFYAVKIMVRFPRKYGLSKRSWIMIGR